MAVKVTKGQIWNGPISKNISKDLPKCCAKFHAFIIKGTILPKIALNLQRYSSCYTAVRIKNCLKSTSVITVATMKNTMVPRTSVISSETEVSIALLCQLCSTRYTAVRIKNCLKSTSVIKVTTMRGTDNFSLRKGSHHVEPVN